MADEAIYNPATGDYSVPSGGGGVNVGVGSLPPLPTLGGSYSADGTGSASNDIMKWIGTLSGIGVSWYGAVDRGGAPAAVAPGAARTPTAANTAGSGAQATGTGTIIVVLLIALLVFFGIRRR